MEGVTVVNTIAEEIHGGSLLGFEPIFGLILAVLGVILIILGFCVPKDPLPIVIGILAIIFGIFVTITTYSYYGPVVDYEYTYEVIIDDTVNLNEFNEKYEIIEQRGDIYTIKEKEPSRQNKTDEVRPTGLVDVIKLF